MVMLSYMKVEQAKLDQKFFAKTGKMTIKLQNGRCLT